MKYLTTKFARFHTQCWKSQSTWYFKTYKFIPLQNFTQNQILIGVNPIEGIDKQLYKKYRLTKEEIKFIESMIKPMAV